MMRKVAVSTAIIGILGACAFVPNPAIPDPARSQEYRLAYMAGSDCGFTDAGRDGFQNAYQLDEKRFNQTLNTEAVGRTAMTPASRSNAVRPLACRLAR